VQKKNSAPSAPVKSTRPVRKHEYEDIDKDLNLSQLCNVEARKTTGLHSNGVGPSTGASSNRYVVGCY